MYFIKILKIIINILTLFISIFFLKFQYLLYLIKISKLIQSKFYKLIMLGSKKFINLESY